MNQRKTGNRMREEVCVGGRRRGAQNPSMEELLAVIDETEGLVRTGGRLGGC